MMEMKHKETTNEVRTDWRWTPCRCLVWVWRTHVIRRAVVERVCWERWNITWSIGKTHPMSLQLRPVKTALTRLAWISLFKLVSSIPHWPRRTYTQQDPSAVDCKLCNFDIAELRLWMEGYTEIQMNVSKNVQMWRSERRSLAVETDW